MMNVNLDEVARRPQRYWNADGLPELTMGALWVVWGVALVLPALLPHGAWLRYYWTAVPAVLICGGVAANWVTKKLKERLTYPRAGYVEFPEPGVLMRIVPALLAMVVASGVVMVLMKAKTQALQDLTAPGCAVLIAAASLFAAVRWRLPHYLILSAASLLAAIVIARAGLSTEPGLIGLFLFLGVISMVLGAVRLRRFLRANPVRYSSGRHGSTA